MARVLVPLRRRLSDSRLTNPGSNPDKVKGLRLCCCQKMTRDRALILWLFTLIASCGQTPDVDPERAARFERAFDDAEVTADVQTKWARSCALCHASGAGGAPRAGDEAAWSSRVQNGRAILMKHTVEGLRRMPPLGYCMDCDLEDFAAMIEMMAGAVDD